MTDDGMWERAVAAVAKEYDALSPSLRARVEVRASAIRAAKSELNAISQGVSGGEICSACRGECCARGKHHFTVVDLLVHMAAGRPLPTPDFAGDHCPWLGSAGCHLEAEYRPFICVTFNCDLVERLLPPPVQERFYRDERKLRGVYRELEEFFGNRFMQGLLLSYERAAGRGERVLRVPVHDAA